jgi:hypothetical protein
MYKWCIKNIKEDGNCFYRAIYNSALKAGLLKKIVKKIKVATATLDEESFIIGLREDLANRIASGNDYNISRDIYTYLASLKKEDYRAIMEAFPMWAQKAFIKLPKKLDTFRRKYAKNVAKLNNWVGELEVRLVCEMLARSHIKINIYNTIPKDTSSLNRKEMHLYNQNEIHYNIIIRRRLVALPIITKTR